MGGVDIATLGLRVDATEAKAARVALDDLTNAGIRSERVVNSYTTAQRLSSSEIARASDTYDRLHRSIDDAHAEALRMNDAMEQLTTTSQGGAVGVGRMNQALVMLARQATGTSPAVAQLVNVLGTFALTAGTMTLILAGLAAIATAFRQIGKDAREAGKEAEEAFKRALDLLNQIADAGVDPVPAALGRIRQRRMAAEAELGAIPDSPFGEYGRQRRKLSDELEDLRRAEDAGVGAVMDARIKSMTVAVGVLTDAIHENMRAFQLSPLGAIAGDPTDIIASGGALSADVLHRARQASFSSPEFMALAEEQQRWIEEQFRLEEDLADARFRANDALIQSLENVGRAYGGVVDQIIALTAAALRMSAMPGFRGRPGTGTGGSVQNSDLARGYGAAALGGVGFGVSTGSPTMGALGGAVSGLASGPYGAIIGGAAGFVSGLIESGRRAREAQRIWEMTFRAFDLMFDDLTPLESKMAALNQAFESLSGGFTVDELRAQTAALVILAAQMGQYSDLIQEVIDRNKKLLDSYEKNAEQARDSAEAERELYDSRFRALNAPAGLNLQRYGYNASPSIDWGAIGVPDAGDGGITVEGDLNITVEGGDSDEIIEKLTKKIRRHAQRGGPSTINAR